MKPIEWGIKNGYFGVYLSEVDGIIFAFIYNRHDCFESDPFMKINTQNITEVMIDYLITYCSFFFLKGLNLSPHVKEYVLRLELLHDLEQ